MISTQKAHWEELRFEWLWVYDGFVPSADTWSQDTVVPTSVFFVREGFGRIEADGALIEVPAGAGFLAAAGVRKHWFSTGSRLLSVGYRATWRDGVPLALDGLNIPLAPARGGSLFSASKKLFREVHAPRKTVGYFEAIEPRDLDFPSWCRHEAAFRNWFAVYVKTLEGLALAPAPRKGVGDQRLREFVRRLDAWPLREPLEWSRIGKDLAIGSRRLEQLFLKELGYTPHEYLNRRRLATAKNLLTGSAIPMKTIAYETGFRYASHFTKWFRRHTKLTPSAYRIAGRAGLHGSGVGA